MLYIFIYISIFQYLFIFFELFILFHKMSTDIFENICCVALWGSMHLKMLYFWIEKWKLLSWHMKTINLLPRTAPESKAQLSSSQVMASTFTQNSDIIPLDLQTSWKRTKYIFRTNVWHALIFYISYIFRVWCFLSIVV